MSVRSRSIVRSERHVPGLGERERQPTTALLERAERGPVHPVAERPVPGESIGVIPTETRPPESARRIRPQPNAPLLKRIVRYPFSLEPARPRKIPVESAAALLPEREPLLAPGSPFAELLAELGPASRRPALRERPRWVPRPFAREAARGAAREAARASAEGEP